MISPNRSAIPLSNISDALSEGADLFICSASFEQRCLSIPKALDLSRIGHALVCTDDHSSWPRKTANTKLLLEHFGNKATAVSVGFNDPLQAADNMQKTLSQFRAYRIVVDITTFTHEMLLILLRLLAMKVDSDDSVTCVYNSAKEYSLGLHGSDKWLTKGIQEVRSVLGYSGAFSAIRKLHLIVLCGFEMERVDGVILTSEPNVVSLGYGHPLASISQEHYKLNKGFHQKLMETYSGTLQFTFSCDDANATKEAVERQIDKFPNHNVVIAPLNTKISTVGAALAALSNQAIQLCYATVDQYNDENYSIPSDDCYVFEVSLRIPYAESVA